MDGVRSDTEAQRQQTKKSAKVMQWDCEMEMVVDFEINQPDKFRYPRSYVVVRLGDKNGKSVRTLSLRGQPSSHGPHWIPDLRRW